MQLKKFIKKLLPISFFVFVLISCDTNSNESKSSTNLKEALVKYENESKRVGNRGNLEVKYLTKGDSFAIQYIKSETNRILRSDSFFQSFITKLSEPKILDTTEVPNHRFIRLLYLGLDNYDDPKVFSYCYRIDLNAFKCYKKKFKIVFPSDNHQKFKLKDAPINIYAQDTFEINEHQIREIKNLLEYNDYWLLDKDGSFGDCSFNTWFIETLWKNDYLDYPNYKRLSGSGRGSMQLVVNYILALKS